ncbi:MAG TPA: hypothetical protein VF297_21840 [Pyrinomonadaceae bacterium]
MKRIRIRVAILMLLVLTLGLVSSSTTTRTVKARDACTDCTVKVQALYDACADLYGETAYCGDLFNDGVVFCYATVCEQ